MNRVQKMLSVQLW